MKQIYLKQESIAYSLLVCWCLLPIFMSLVTLIYYLFGIIPPLSLIGVTGINFTCILNIYYKVFRVLGGITLFFVSFCLVAGHRQLFKLSNLKQKPWFYILIVLLLWSVICAYKSDDVISAMFSTYYLCDNLYSYFIYGGVFACASFIKDTKKRKSIILLFCFMVLYNATIIIIQTLTNSNVLNSLFPSLRAVVFNQFNHFGYLLCMAIICLMALYLYEDKVIYLILIGYLFYALLINDTFGCQLATYIATPITYGLYLLNGRKINIKKTLPIIVIALLSVLSIYNLLPSANALSKNLTTFASDVDKVATQAEDMAKAGTTRMQLWLDTFERIKQRPIFGFGPEGFIGKNSITNGDSPHNEYLQITGFLGFPGLFLYLSAFITLCINKIKNIKTISILELITGSTLIVYLISALFGNPVFNTYPYMWLMYGLVINDPLINLDDKEILNELDSKPTKEKLIKTTISCFVIAIIVFYVIMLFAKYKFELMNEESDLSSMKSINSYAQAALDNGYLKEGGTYYYDENNYSILEQIPSNGYGYGTSINGNVVDSFNQNNDADYIYDGSLDYTNSVIKITIVDNKPIIEWVELD